MGGITRGPGRQGELGVTRARTVGGHAPADLSPAV